MDKIVTRIVIFFERVIEMAPHNFLYIGKGFNKTAHRVISLKFAYFITLRAMPLIAASVHCLPDILWHSCIVTYCFLSVWGLFKAMHAKSPWERRLCFSPPFMMRMLVLVLRSFSIGGGNPEAFTHVVLQDLIAVIGGIIGALRVPEKWIPGRVDLLLNSHNIMHVMVVLAVCSMHAATVQDLSWMIEPKVCLEDLSDAKIELASITHTEEL